MLLIDETNLIIGNNALSYGSTILNTLNAGVQLNVLHANGMVSYTAEKAVTGLSFVERLLYDPQLSLYEIPILWNTGHLCSANLFKRSSSNFN